MDKTYSFPHRNQKYPKIFSVANILKKDFSTGNMDNNVVPLNFQGRAINIFYIHI